MTYRLLALDVDGTLLDPYGALTPAAREAVANARRAGLTVVLCTGRRFRTVLPVLRELELEGPVVVNNGAVVKDVASARTLHHAYLPSDLYPHALELMRARGTPLVYVDSYETDVDMFTEERSPHPYQQGYLKDHHAHCRTVRDLSDAPRTAVIMLSMMADEATLLPLREHASGLLGDRIASHLIANKNYEGLILELFSPRSGKWHGLSRVAADLGVAPEEVAAVGDDANDADLLRHVGLGIAMGNAVPEALEAADCVVRSNAEGGIAEAVQRILSAR